MHLTLMALSNLKLLFQLANAEAALVGNKSKPHTEQSIYQIDKTIQMLHPYVKGES